MNNSRPLEFPIPNYQFLTRTAPFVLAAVLFIVYLTTLAPGVTWANDGADGGDFIAAAATLGVAHPTGYPTYILLVRLFQLLPVGSLAVRTNLLSATCAALAAAGVVLLVRRSYGGAARFAWTGGLTAGFAFGLSPLLWSQAVIAEVYTLHALFVALILLCLPLRAERRDTDFGGLKRRIGGLLIGLALGNHLTTILLLPPWLLLIGWEGKRVRWRDMIDGLAGLAVGALVYLYLPLRARAMPPINWGDAATWEGFWWVISGEPYQGFLFGLPTEQVLVRIPAGATLLATQFGWLGLLLVLYGLFFGHTVSRRVKWITGWTAVTFSIFAIGYAPVDSFVYLLPAFLAVAVWLGLGVATALEGLPSRLAGFAPAVACLALLVMLANAGVTLPQVDASHDLRAEAFGRTVMAQAPPDAIIFTDGDRGVFSLWYFHLALSERPDVAVIVDVLRGFEWYQESLRATYPELVVPDYWEFRTAWKRALITANEGRPACETDPDAKVVLVCN